MDWRLELITSSQRIMEYVVSLLTAHSVSEEGAEQSRAEMKIETKESVHVLRSLLNACMYVQEERMMGDLEALELEIDSTRISDRPVKSEVNSYW